MWSALPKNQKCVLTGGSGRGGGSVRGGISRRSGGSRRGGGSDGGNDRRDRQNRGFLGNHRWGNPY